MIKRFTSVWVILLMLLQGIAFAEPIQPMGRYVESMYKLPEGLQDVPKLLLSDDGQLTILGVGRGCIIAYDGDGQGWVETDETGEYDFSFIDIVKHGESYFDVHIQDQPDGNYLYQFRQYQDGEMRTLPIDLSGMYPQQIAVSTDGMLLASLPDGPIITFDPATGEMLHRFDGLDGAFTTQDNQLFAISTAGRSVMQYDLASGNLVNEMKQAPFTGNDALAFDGESLFMVNGGGIYRITPGGTIWEQLLSGSLTSLRMPSVELDGMAVRNGEVYVLTHKDFEPTLYAYRYDATISTLPRYELKAYTLYENPTLTQAAALFQKQNPDYMVNITALLTDGTGVTADDAIRALNTELLSGKGPDVLVLDGMPAADYAEKGVLLDLSGLVGELDSAGELISSLIKPLYRDGKLFSVPTSCLLPGLIGRKEDIGHADTLDSLASMVMQSAAESPIPWRTRQGYFDIFLPASYPAWFGADGQLDEALFAGYLEAIDKLYQASCSEQSLQSRKAYLDWLTESQNSGDLMNGQGGYKFELSRLLEGRVAVYPFALGNFSVSLLEGSLLEIYQTGELGGAFAWMPGQAERVYVPRSMLGVNARSGQVDAAMQLVRTALSQEVQNTTADIGLPVNQKTMTMLVEDEERHGALGGSYLDRETNESLDLFGLWPKREQREMVADKVSEAATPYMPDNTLIGMMKTELAPYFDSKMDAQAAAQAVSAKVRAYLAE